jgi:hypothetical protein
MTTVARNGRGGALIAPPAALTDPLAPVRETICQLASRTDLPPMNGIAAGLTITETAGWVPATELVSGAAIDDMLAAAERRWNADPHAAAALAWKSYSFWLALPAVIGYAVARRVPLVRPEGVVARWSTEQPFMTVGLTAIEVAVLPRDPLAMVGSAGVRVVADETALLGELRTALMDDHLTPMLEQIRSRRHLGHRTLWGSLASGVAHGLSRAADVVPGPTMETADHVLASLGIQDLVELGERPGSSGLTVQRKTCCLAFTLPEPKICAGCCIRP